MTVICPTITAFDTTSYKEQMESVYKFADVVHIDLMDGDFAPSTSPELKDIWIPHGLVFDIHFMYRRPMDYLEQLTKLKPRMVIVHAEADMHHSLFAAEMHKAGILAGLALLSDTSVESCEDKISGFDHALIFSGNLGYHGGEANVHLLHKIPQLKEHHPYVEIGWDGGINTENAKTLVENGVDVLNVGGYIQNSDDPHASYLSLVNMFDSSDIN